ncbi:TRAP transporter substrate-binding protein [Rhodobacter sp. NTK016B]|uniref:TRAP transporter substrate-binding protein n=1 Tax=Rhodobacter sp. NTK016B TaxID=2759676 RepID=UPI001A8D67DD|nr:TRAP transporter substrate-binding protein [Rhodobacter sp. NTK016B]MBN8292434.1 TRAP transporter substrate-binding protein [Rhodobacter sp. NTK016B]
MIRRTLAALLSSAALFATGPAIAQETLSFGTANPEQHPLVTRILTPWAEAINAEDPSVLEIQLRNGPMIVNHTNFFDRVQDDVVQMVFGITAFDPGRFPRSLVTTLPFMVQSAEQGALAACLFYEAGGFGEETADIVPLLFVQFPQASLHFQDHPATSMEDMAGMKVMTGSPVVSGLIQAYGGTPLSINVPEMYQALQRGTAEGLVMNFTAFPGFRLNEVTTDHLIAPLGGGLGLVFMMRDRFDALPEAAQEILERHSTCETSRETGAAIDAWEAEALAFVQSDGERRFHTMTEEQVAELVDRVGGPIEASYIERTPGGAEALEIYRQALDDASATLAE